MARKSGKGEAQATQHIAITIAELKRSHMQIYLMGDSPLIVHAWSQKAKLEMLSKHMGSIKIREHKDPYDDFLRCIYRMEDGHYGFPVVGVKEAMATAATDLENIAKAAVYRNVMVTGKRGFQVAAFADLRTPQELAELFSPNAASIREDMVKLSGIGRTPDIRYRAEFHPWALRFNLGYSTQFITAESVINLLQHAGFQIGLGEWRQERGGSNGAFHVASAEEVKEVERWIKRGQQEPKVIDSKAWLAGLAAKAAKATIEKAAAPNGVGVVRNGPGRRRAVVAPVDAEQRGKQAVEGRRRARKDKSEVDV